jgi:hypothetical protein
VSHLDPLRQVHRQARYGWQTGLRAILLIGLLAVLPSGCASLLGPEIPTPLPTEYIPTVIALTMEAAGLPQPQAAVVQATPSEAPFTVAPAIVTETITPQPSLTPTRQPTPAGPTDTPYPITLLPPLPSATPPPAVANDLIEIRNLGPLSKVVSPLHIYAYLLPGYRQRVLVELLGEDRRVLFREIKAVLYVNPGAMAIVTLDKAFEIQATAEAGRLVISTADQYGRLTALNSVPLILLSVGDADISPPADQYNPILIGEPTPKTLIQGGRLLVTGLARPNGEGPLMIQLIDQQGAVVGQRLANITPPDAPGGYGKFATEVTYTVSAPTPVLLTVWEGGDSIEDIIHLTSREIVLSP